MADDRPGDDSAAPNPPAATGSAVVVVPATEEAATAAAPESEAPQPARAAGRGAAATAAIAAVSGAMTAALIVGGAWAWMRAQPAPAGATAAALDALDALAARVAALEARPAPTTAAADPALAPRIATLEDATASQRDRVATIMAQINEITAAQQKSAPAPAAAAPPPDLSAVTERLTRLERAPPPPPPPPAKPYDDLPLRRVLAAMLLDDAVRSGAPYSAQLDLARSLASDAAALSPVAPFTATGVPDAGALGRELAALMPKLSNAQAAAGGNLMDRLRSGADKLVRIERVDAPGDDRAAIVSRIGFAARSGDVAAALRDLAALPPDARAPAQGWIDRATAREAALAASRAFANDALASLSRKSTP